VIGGLALPGRSHGLPVDVGIACAAVVFGAFIGGLLAVALDWKPKRGGRPHDPIGRASRAT
jgi:hypothetical protein